MANQRATTEAVLGAGAVLRGRASGEGALRVLGTIEGEVTLRGHLTIAQSGAVRGETLSAHDVEVEGELSADVDTEGTLTVHPGATLRGKVRARSLRIHAGSSISAHLDCDFDLPEELR